MQSAKLFSRLGFKSFSSYAPKSMVAFSNEGKKLLFSYNDDKTFRDGLLLGTGAQSSFLAYYFLVYESTMSLVGFGLTSIFSLGIMAQARNTPALLHLMKDGQHIELINYTPTGKQSQKAVKIPISEIKALKGRDGYKIVWKKRVFVLSREGQVHDWEILLAVLRGLSIETDQFVTEA